MTTLTTSAHYFTTKGPDNTLDTLKLARARMDELNIPVALVATTNGDAGVKALDVFRGRKLICVSHVTGFASPDTQELTPENRAVIEAAGVPILTAAHAFSGVDRAIRGKFSTMEPIELMANTLRLFCEGMKVSVEIALMAADAGLIRTDTPVICVAGTSHGSDTAVILKPSNAHTIFDLKIIEIVCMPSPLHPAIHLEK
jgi:hypothetical protein